MDRVSLKAEVAKHFDYLEALAFFVQDLHPTLIQNLSDLKVDYEYYANDELQRLLALLNRDIENTREGYGALSSNDFYREQLAILRNDAPRGYGYISKLTIEKVMFSNYVRVFPRWPHMKYHAQVIFDGKEDKTRGQIYQLDAVLWDDVKLMLQESREIHGGEEDFRKRGTDQIKLQSYLRSTTTAIFTFLEAYLNGIAYDCFQLHHDELDIKDHDLLAEWDSEKKKQKFVKSSVKVFRYPRIVAKLNGLNFNLGGVKSAHKIVQDGKSLRDSITHPSPHHDKRQPEPFKLTALMRINLPAIEALFTAARDYVEAVETGIGEDPHHSVPYLYT